MRCLFPRRFRLLPLLWAMLAGFTLWTLADPPASAPTYPAWWIPNVVSAQPPADTGSPAFADWMATNYRPANLGQLKNVATQARLHLAGALAEIGGAGADIDSLVDGINAPASLTNEFNYAPANLGQLKNVAKPFYDRLIAIGYTGAPPWTLTASAVNFSPANLGQLKHVFSFDLSTFTLAPNVTTDGDSLPDKWEVAHGLDPFSGSGESGSSGDADHDGLTNADEFTGGTDPLAQDNPAGGNLTILLYK